MSSSTAPELCSVRRPGEPQTFADPSESATRQPAKKKRRSADAAALGSSFGQAKREPITLGGGTGTSSPLTGLKARDDPQQAYHATKKLARTTSEASWVKYIEWKQSSSLKACFNTGAILSIRAKVRVIRSARARLSGASLQSSTSPRRCPGRRRRLSGRPRTSICASDCPGSSWTC